MSLVKHTVHYCHKNREGGWGGGSRMNLRLRKTTESTFSFEMKHKGTKCERRTQNRWVKGTSSDGKHQHLACRHSMKKSRHWLLGESSEVSSSQGLRAVAGVAAFMRVATGLVPVVPGIKMQLAIDGGTLSPITSTHSLGKNPTCFERSVFVWLKTKESKKIFCIVQIWKADESLGQLNGIS